MHFPVYFDTKILCALQYSKKSSYKIQTWLTCVRSTGVSETCKTDVSQTYIARGNGPLKLKLLETFPTRTFDKGKEPIMVMVYW